MKGQIEKILALIWILIPVMIIVGVHGGNIFALADGGRTLEAQFSAAEIASAISVLQSGPDGVRTTYKLPSVDYSSCVNIYQTYVETKFGLLGGRLGTSELIESAMFSANIDGATGGQPIVIGCTSAGKSLVMMKENGKIKIIG